MSEYYAPMEDGALAGFSRVSGYQGIGKPRQDPVREAKIASAYRLLRDVSKGYTPSWLLQEALAPRTPQALRILAEHYPHIVTVRESITTSDFPLLTGDILDRALLDRFNAQPGAWREYIRVGRPLNDFRNVRRIGVDGLEDQYDPVPEGDSIHYGSPQEAGYLYAPHKYAKGAKLSFESIMNDDLGAFDEIPDRLARGGQRTVHKFATDLLFDASGPDATFFSAGNGNLITGNPPLDITSLGAGMEQLLGFLDVDGEPILVEGVRLVVGPGLWVTANNIMNQLTVDLSDTGGASNQVVRTNNWIVRQMTLVMDPYIPIIATTNGDTSWLLMSDPNTGRPAAEVGFLRGFETPQLFQKAGNTTRVGGGVDQALGDFETMAQHYKGVIAFGGTTIEPKSGVGSNGSGS